MQDMLKKYGHFDWQRLVPLAILGASVSALAVAHTAEVVFSLEACNLCLYQRVPYLLGCAMLAPDCRFVRLPIGFAPEFRSRCRKTLRAFALHRPNDCKAAIQFSEVSRVTLHTKSHQV